MALIPPFFLDAVAAIGFPDDKGQTQWGATGFFFGRFLQQTAPDQKQYQVFLVTNKHVLRKKGMAKVRLNPDGDQPAREFDMELVDGSGTQLWIGHPDDDVDVAVNWVAAGLLREQGIRFAWFQSDTAVLVRSKAAELGVTEGDGVFVLGFPLGIVGEKRNFVVVRGGCIARVSDCLAGHRKDFLVDSAIFPGNSGGPVVLRPETIAIEGTKAVQSAYLLGVLAGYVSYNDVAVSAQTQQVRVVFQENSGLAYCPPGRLHLRYCGQTGEAPRGEAGGGQATRGGGRRCITTRWSGPA